jgi:hypothetical protein
MKQSTFWNEINEYQFGLLGWLWWQIVWRWKKYIYYPIWHTIWDLLHKEFLLYQIIYDTITEDYDDQEYGEHVEDIRDHIMDEFKKHDYYGAVRFLDNGYRLPCFEVLFYKVPKKYQYEFFIDFYTFKECHFGDIDKQIAEQAFSLAPKKFKRKLKKCIEPDGYITIYRGEASASTPAKDAYSWTLKKDIAKFFATRWWQDGIIYIAKVKLDKIIDYIDDRSEDEILVRYKDVQIIGQESVISKEKIITGGKNE